MAQDDYYYEIQLTNKQLVFYLMAAAAGLIVSFLLGVMVGRGVDSSAGDVRASHVVAEDRIVPEESPSAKPTAAPAEELTYAQRLESDKVDDSLKPATGAAAVPPQAKVKATPAPPKPTPPPATDPSKTAETPAPAKTATPKPSPAASPKPPRDGKAASSSPSAFTIQVGAFKDRATAESVVERLK